MGEGEEITAMTGDRDGDPIDERYRAFETGDGEILVYDSTNHAAWIQSDIVVGVDVP